jgi:hypothetical protein
LLEQRRAGEADEGGIGQRQAHVARESPAWVRCASSEITMMSSRSL